MEHENSLQKYREWYGVLLRLYPGQYRERFAESMEQTFHDLCRERRESGVGLFGFATWTFVETSAEIIKENIMQNTMNTLIKTGDVVLILGFLAVDFFFFHDFLKAGEAISVAQYLVGILSILVIAMSARSLAKN